MTLQWYTLAWRKYTSAFDVGMATWPVLINEVWARGTHEASGGIKGLCSTSWAPATCHERKVPWQGQFKENKEEGGCEPIWSLNPRPGGLWLQAELSQPNYRCEREKSMLVVVCHWVLCDLLCRIIIAFADWYITLILFFFFFTVLQIPVFTWASLMAQTVKKMPVMQET